MLQRRVQGTVPKWCSICICQLWSFLYRPAEDLSLQPLLSSIPPCKHSFSERGQLPLSCECVELFQPGSEEKDRQTQCHCYRRTCSFHLHVLLPRKWRQQVPLKCWYVTYLTVIGGYFHVCFQRTWLRLYAVFNFQWNIKVGGCEIWKTIWTLFWFELWRLHLASCKIHTWAVRLMPSWGKTQVESGCCLHNIGFSLGCTWKWTHAYSHCSWMCSRCSTLVMDAVNYQQDKMQWYLEIFCLNEILLCVDKICMYVIREIYCYHLHLAFLAMQYWKIF